MLFSIGVVLVGIAIFFAEYPYLNKNKMKKETAAMLFVLVAATGLGVAYGFRLPLPSPLDWVITIYKPISEPLKPWLAD